MIPIYIISTIHVACLLETRNFSKELSIRYSYDAGREVDLSDYSGSWRMRCCVDFVEVPQLSPDYLPKCADRIIAMIDAIFNNEKRTDSFEDIYRVFLCPFFSKDR